MRCLYCGKEYWLPAQIRRDPDFCSAAHREKYNGLVERAMRCIQESAPLPPSEPMPAPVMAAPTERRVSLEAQAGTEPAAAAHATAAVTADLSARAERSEPPAPPASAAAAGSVSRAAELRGRTASAASLDKARALSHAEPRRFRESPHIPQLAAQPVFERLEPEAIAANPAEKTDDESSTGQKETASGLMFSLLETSGARRKTGRLVLTALAACTAVGAVLWIGTNAARWGQRPPSPPVLRTAMPEIASASVPAAHPEPPSLEPSISWFRSAAMHHAAAHLSESFETGMAAWGVSSTEWAPGWSHSRDGYVRPGQLAFFRPTLGYADYRMEFFGEIENKSLSWVVRGKDPHNYYAMKLTLTQPGLRPLLSLAHYPVVDGKAGHAVEVPLSVMIHNGLPYHVAVQVEGSNYRVWIEGEPVDSWSDDALPAGAVGFFAEPGARARVYWLNVSKNDTWLGWLCARIAGTAGSRETAI